MTEKSLSPSDYVVISKEEYLWLLYNDAKMSRLEAGGVDNWSYYGESFGKDYNGLTLEEEEEQIAKDVENYKNPLPILSKAERFRLLCAEEFMRLCEPNIDKGYIGILLDDGYNKRVEQFRKEVFGEK